MRTLFALGIVVVTAICGQFVTAQPPERRDGPPPERRDGLRDALDTNGDHELDAEEIKNAAESLAKAIEIQPGNRKAARSDSDFHEVLQHSPVRELVYSEKIAGH